MTRRQLLLPIFLCVALLLTPSRALAHPGDNYVISLLTMSPGDSIFFKFGHNAILVRDVRRTDGQVYNWGTFSFDEDGLVSKFLRGRLTYWLAVQGLQDTIDHYRQENRWIREQELNLTADQKVKLVELIRENARPQNRKYRYDYYRDNCSTRVRDALDFALDGKLRAATSGPGTLTFRQHTSRLVADDWPGYVFLNLAMGNYIDQPTTEWEEMFVPEKVQQAMRPLSNLDSEGQTVPLVRAERTLLEAPGRRGPDAMPPKRGLALLLMGALVGLILGFMSYRLLRPILRGERPSVGARLGFAIPLITLTALTSLLGILFVFFWVATDHKVAYHNENLLQTSPLTITIPVLTVGLVLLNRKAIRAWIYLTWIIAGLSFLGLALKVIPAFDQVNGEIIALMLPIWVGLAVAGHLARRGTASVAQPETSSDQKTPEAA